VVTVSTLRNVFPRTDACRNEKIAAGEKRRRFQGHPPIQCASAAVVQHRADELRPLHRAGSSCRRADLSCVGDAIAAGRGRRCSDDASVRPPPQPGGEDPAAVSRRRAPPCLYPCPQVRLLAKSEAPAKGTRMTDRSCSRRRQRAATRRGRTPFPPTTCSSAWPAPTSPGEGQELGMARASPFLAARPSRLASARRGRPPLPQTSWSSGRRPRPAGELLSTMSRPRR
jgi:hypothetical protein